MQMTSMPLLTDVLDEWESAPPPESLAVDSQCGTTIGNGTYSIDSVLGQGGMGIVYAGVHTWTGRQVAIKILRRDMTDGVDVSRVLQEARAATSVAHPNVVEVLDMGRDPDGRVYLVFERLIGETLADVLDRGLILTPEEAAEILLPVLDALAVAHELGIVHRDLKPENIFLARDPNGTVRPKLLDFGLAKMRRSGARRTQTGVISGTPAYMSPERAIGQRETGPETDVWSMGVVLYECFTNRLPFYAEHSMGVLLAVVNEPVPSLRNTPGVPRAVADVVDAALSRDVGRRLPDAAALRDALARALGVTERPSTPTITSIRVTATGPAVRQRASYAHPERPTIDSASLGGVLLPPLPRRLGRSGAVAMGAGVLALAFIVAFIFREPARSEAEPVRAATVVHAAAQASAVPAVSVAPAPTAPVVVAPPPAPTAAVTPARRARVTTARPERGRSAPRRGTRGAYILE